MDLSVNGCSVRAHAKNAEVGNMAKSSFLDFPDVASFVKYCTLVHGLTTILWQRVFIPKFCKDSYEK